MQRRVLDAIIEHCQAHGGEMPNRGELGPGMWALLARECEGLGVGIGVREYPTRQYVTVAGVPIMRVEDLEDGLLLLWNHRAVTHAELHEQAAPAAEPV